MLENLRDKFFSVQQGVSASLKNLKTGEVSLTRSKSQLFRRKHFSCSFNAGADLLQYYQKQWESLHNYNEINAKEADEVGTLIEELHIFCLQQNSTMQQMTAQLAQVPRLQASVIALMNKIGELEGMFEEVESALINLEDIIETQELQEKQLDQRFHLALHKERCLANYEETKSKLAVDHTQKLIEFELKQQNLLRERQEAFKEVFEEEMEMYKTMGRIETKPSSASSPTLTVGLEEIQLDENQEDQDKFDAFLGDERSNTDGELVSSLVEADTTADESDSSFKGTES